MCLMESKKRKIQVVSSCHELSAVNSLAKIEQPSSTEAQIWFSPSIEDQRELTKKLADKKEQVGLRGQFVVQYDVDRDPQAGEVLVS